MPLPPKNKAQKLKAFAKKDEDKKGKPPEEEQDEKDTGGEDEEEGGKKGKGGDEDKHLSHEETQQLLSDAEQEAEESPDGALTKALAGYDGSGDAPAGFDEDVWEAAAEIVGPDDYQGEADPWLVVAHVYKHMGGKVEGGEGEGESADEATPDE
jgi:hypothetical protein